MHLPRCQNGSPHMHFSGVRFPCPPGHSANAEIGINNVAITQLQYCHGLPPLGDHTQRNNTSMPTRTARDRVATRHRATTHHFIATEPPKGWSESVFNDGKESPAGPSASPTRTGRLGALADLGQRERLGAGTPSTSIASTCHPRKVYSLDSNCRNRSALCASNTIRPGSSMVTRVIVTS